MIDEAEEFLNNIEGQLADSTIKGHRANLRKFSEFLNDRNIAAKEAQWVDIEDFLKQQYAEEYSNHTIRNRYISIRRLYNRLHKRSIIENNPADKIKIGDIVSRTNKRKKKHKDKRVWLEQEEISQLTEAAPQPAVRNRLIIRWMYYTACRRSEVSNVKLDDLNFETRKFEVYSPKKGETIKGRWHPDLDNLLNEWLEEHRPNYTTNDSDHLFITSKSEQVAPNHISRIVREAADRAGIQDFLYEDKQGNDRKRVTSHSLRHSYAMHFLARPDPGSFEELKKILSHEDVTTTQIYGDLDHEDVDEAYRNSTPSLNDDSSGKRLEQKCEKCGKTKSKMVTHHVSYKPEEIMEICSDCHLEIHNRPSKYSHLMPEISRKKAKEKGWI
jgi:integrase/recombinase XerD